MMGPVTAGPDRRALRGHASPECVAIDRVEIVRHDIFEARHGGAVSWPYRLANRLHFRTREDVIRREVLFASDQCADAETLAQTERNLRATGFLRDARVETVPAESGRPGAVDVRVSTWEKWTTAPRLGFMQVGNRSVWSVGIAERNLFGRGLSVEVQRRSDIDRDQTLVAVRDPGVAGSRLQAAALVRRP
jgi:outer membrane protein assembly factor BamA